MPNLYSPPQNLVATLEDGPQVSLTWDPPASLVLVEVIEESGEWTEPNDQWVSAFVEVIGAGGGGEGGSQSGRNGGESGAGGGLSTGTYDRTTLTSPQTVVIGAGGAGGLGGVGGLGGHNAEPGNPGGTTSFGALLSATGGEGGNPDGGVDLAEGGVGNTGVGGDGVEGGGNSTGGDPGNPGTNSAPPSGGGGGGAIGATGSTGGAGGDVTVDATTVPGAAGGGPGLDAADGTVSLSIYRASGGGGGGGSIDFSAGQGGDGGSGVRFGAGGGGGGAQVNASPDPALGGDGGDGGTGAVIIYYTYLGPGDVPDFYAVYRDGVLLDVVDALSGLDYIDAFPTPGATHTYTVRAYDDYTEEPISDDSNPQIVFIPTGTFEKVLRGFDDERVFGGYIGGKLRGTTIACPGDNVNKVKPCC